MDRPETADMTEIALPLSAPAGRAAAKGDRAQAIRQSVINAILEQRLLPGTKMGEDELGQIFGASRTIVRGALQSLAQEGILVIEKNRGAFVAQPSRADAQEVFEARKLIEPTIARIAAARRNGDDALTRHLATEADAIERGDDRAAIRLSGEFHLLIAERSGHRVYANFLRELVARSSLIILLYHSRAARISCTDHHRPLAAAIEAGEGDRAAALMIHHLDEIEQGLDLAEEPRQPSMLSEILGA